MRPRSEAGAILVAGLGFGDEGKGTTVDYFTRMYGAHTIIRYNGGAQAIHSVVTKNGRHHAFAQFGSGMFVSGVRTHLSRFVVINPETMMNEEIHLKQVGIKDAFARTTIDGDALVVTPYQKITNQLREISRSHNRHGSCGMGIGEAIADRTRYGDKILFAKDLKDQKLTREKLEFIRWEKIKSVFILDLPDEELVLNLLEILDSDLYLEKYLRLYKIFATELANIVEGDYLGRIVRRGKIIFEGAQGILIDPIYGSSPYVTKTDISFNNALTLLKEVDYGGQVRRIGVVRAYATRHGTGPFPTEDEKMTQLLPDIHNPEGPWQGKFRIGYFDSIAIRYAMKAIGQTDDIVMTNIDRLVGLRPLKVCTEYDSKTNKPIYENMEEIKSNRDYFRYVEFIRSLGIPVSILSFGPTAEDKQIL